jgi:aromatic ring-opening dioxygenase catalytic subunit (LigB family)
VHLFTRESYNQIHISHAQEDHFMPIHVAAGAAEGEKGHVIYSGNETYEGRIAVSSFRFGDELPPEAPGEADAARSEL